MKPMTRQTLAVTRSFDMSRLRTKAAIMQHWRRRLAAAEGPRGWTEFLAMYRGELDVDRRRLAGQIRELRRRGGIA